jgi:hypothetical protein
MMTAPAKADGAIVTGPTPLLPMHDITGREAAAACSVQPVLEPPVVHVVVGGFHTSVRALNLKSTTRQVIILPDDVVNCHVELLQTRGRAIGVLIDTVFSNEAVRAGHHAIGVCDVVEPAWQRSEVIMPGVSIGPTELWRGIASCSPSRPSQVLNPP